MKSSDKPRTTSERCDWLDKELEKLRAEIKELRQIIETLTKAEVWHAH